MYISFIRIANYRNFKDFTLDLSPNSVIVGENATGKSNLVQAIRLVLDPTLPDSERTLVSADFWDGDPKCVPAYRGTCIEVTLRIADLDKEARAILKSFCIPDDEFAEISYRFEPSPDAMKKVNKGKLEVALLGPGEYGFNYYHNKPGKPLLNTTQWQDTHELAHEFGSVRRFVAVQWIPASRDIVSMASWQRSPLRSLIERLKLPDDTDFTDKLDQLSAITNDLRGLPSIATLEKRIKSRLDATLLGGYQPEPRLSATPISPNTVSRSFRVYLDGEKWLEVADASLGIANILYLTLLAIDLEARKDKDKLQVLLIIEEPEAHLHPHLQRLVFRDYFAEAEKRHQPVLVVTHSPNLVAATSISSICVLRQRARGTYGISTKTLHGKLSVNELNDIKRYLDVTRSEIVFSRGVILVEGRSESILLPRLLEGASFNSVGELKTLDQLGISICNVEGVGFKSFVLFLRSLQIPYVVLTDGDPYFEVDGHLLHAGLDRGIAIVNSYNSDLAGTVAEKCKQSDFKKLFASLRRESIFVNHSTFEIELIRHAAKDKAINTFAAFKAGRSMMAGLKECVDRLSGASQWTPSIQEDAGYFISHIEHRPCFGKGRYAQELASRVDATDLPRYIHRAIGRLIQEVGKSH